MKAATNTQPRRDTLNLRIPAAERNLIDRAALSTGKTRTDFILEAARRAAEEALLERAILSVGAEAYAEFLARLELPAQPNERLRHTMQVVPPAVGKALMLLAPELLASHHQLTSFDSGVPSLDDRLKRRATLNQASGALRTFVTCEGVQVIGYYCLASSAVAPAAAPGRFRRNMPDPVLVVVLGRLAVARSHQSHGLGRALFQDAARRVIHAAEAIGIRGLLVHALSDEAKSFYLRLGLDASPLEPMTLMVTIADLRAALAE